MSPNQTRLAIFLAALVFEVVVSVVHGSRVGHTVPELAVYFDGHLYMQIAKSFPLPFDAMGPHYQGHAPGYAFGIALIELLTPSAWVNWGLAAMLTTWLAGAACAVVFFDLCRALGAPPLTGAVLFSVANPRWITASRS